MASDAAMLTGLPLLNRLWQTREEQQAPVRAFCEALEAAKCSAAESVASAVLASELANLQSEQSKLGQQYFIWSELWNRYQDESGGRGGGGDDLLQQHNQRLMELHSDGRSHCAVLQQQIERGHSLERRARCKTEEFTRWRAMERAETALMSACTASNKREERANQFASTSAASPSSDAQSPQTPQTPRTPRSPPSRTYDGAILTPRSAARRCIEFGEVGRVLEEDLADPSIPYKVQGPRGDISWFKADEVRLVSTAPVGARESGLQPGDEDVRVVFDTAAALHPLRDEAPGGAAGDALWMEPEVRKGSRVLLVGLERDSELNGTEGTVTDFVAGSVQPYRYRVKCDADGKTRNLKARNVRLRAQPVPTPSLMAPPSPAVSRETSRDAGGDDGDQRSQQQRPRRGDAVTLRRAEPAAKYHEAANGRDDQHEAWRRGIRCADMLARVARMAAEDVKAAIQDFRHVRSAESGTAMHARGVGLSDSGINGDGLCAARARRQRLQAVMDTARDCRRKWQRQLDSALLLSTARSGRGAEAHRRWEQRRYSRGNPPSPGDSVPEDLFEARLLSLGARPHARDSRKRSVLHVAASVDNLAVAFATLVHVITGHETLPAASEVGVSQAFEDESKQRAEIFRPRMRLLTSRGNEEETQAMRRRLARYRWRYAITCVRTEHAGEARACPKEVGVKRLMWVLSLRQLPFGWTPLHAAAYSGSRRITRLICSTVMRETEMYDRCAALVGDVLGARDALGKTPLQHAAACGHTDVVELLCEYDLQLQLLRLDQEQAGARVHKQGMGSLASERPGATDDRLGVRRAIEFACECKQLDTVYALLTYVRRHGFHEHAVSSLPAARQLDGHSLAPSIDPEVVRAVQGFCAHVRHECRQQELPEDPQYPNANGGANGDHAHAPARPQVCPWCRLDALTLQNFATGRCVYLNPSLEEEYALM